MTLDDLWGPTSFNKKKLRLHNVDILEIYLKDKVLHKKNIAEKDDFESLRWPYVTSNDIQGQNSFEKLCLYNVIIHTKFRLNQILNKINIQEKVKS